jgi:hypothetical protein
MIDDKTVVEAYIKRCDHLARLLPRLNAAKEKFEALDDERLDCEADILRMRQLLEDIDVEQGSFHDQLAHDFSLEKYGRNHRHESRHGTNYDIWRCEVQCPLCKKYEVTVRYVKRKFGDLAVIREEVEKGRFANGLYYCEGCEVPE